MKEFGRRILAYARGDFVGSAGVSDELVKKEGNVVWVAESDAMAKYALEAALRSVAHAEQSVSSIVGKAASLVPILIGLSSVAIAATGLVAHMAHSRYDLWWAVTFVSSCTVALFLLVAAMNALLATTPARTGGLNLARLTHKKDDAESMLVCQEAIVWHRAALLAMETVARKGNDLFAAWRCLLGALVAAAVGAVAWLGDLAH